MLGSDSMLPFSVEGRRGEDSALAAERRERLGGVGPPFSALVVEVAVRGLDGTPTPEN